MTVGVLIKKPSASPDDFTSRDDKIRTCDPTPPRRVRYRAALHPEKCKIIESLIMDVILLKDDIHDYLLSV
jgi:hypothetical protein